MSGKAQEPMSVHKPLDKDGLDLSIMSPKCPYHPEAKSEFYCPYFVFSPQFGLSPMIYGPQRWYSTSSLVMGIIAMATFWLCFVPFVGFFIFIVVMVLSILAIVFGAIGMRKIPAGMRGRGGAIAGFIMGILALILGSVLVIFCSILTSQYRTMGV